MIFVWFWLSVMAAVIAAEIYFFVRLVISGNLLAWAVIVAIVIHTCLLIWEIRKTIALHKETKKIMLCLKETTENWEREDCDTCPAKDYCYRYQTRLIEEGANDEQAD